MDGSVLFILIVVAVLALGVISSAVSRKKAGNKEKEDENQPVK